MKKTILTCSSYLYLMSYAFFVSSIGLCNKPVAATFHLNERAMGWLIFSHFAGFIIMTVGAGMLADRIGLKPVMIGSIFAQGLALIGFGSAKSVPSIYIMMLFTGFAGGAVESAVNALISKLYPETRSFSLNLLHIFFGTGAFTWPMIGGQLLRNHVSWRWLIIILGIYSLVIGLLVAVQKFEVRSGGDSMRISDAFSLVKKPAMIFIGLMVAFYVGSEMGINAWIVRYFDEQLLNGQPLGAFLPFGLNPATGIVLTLYWASMTFGRLFSTYAASRVPDYKLLRFLTTISAVAGIAAFSVRGVLPAVIFLIITGISFSGIFATAIAAGNNRFPEYTGSVSGFVIGFSGIGNMVLNVIIGNIIQETGSIRSGMLFAAALLFAMAACSFAIKKAPEAIET